MKKLYFSVDFLIYWLYSRRYSGKNYTIYCVSRYKEEWDGIGFSLRKTSQEGDCDANSQY